MYIINGFFLIKSSVSRGFNFEWQTECAVLLLSFKYNYLEDTQNWFFRWLWFLRFTHSSVFQCIWNFQSFQFWFSVCRFIYISSSFYCAFLLSLILFRGGRFPFNLFMYQPPSISCNNDWRFYLWLGGLGSLTGIFWKYFHGFKINIRAF